MYQGNSHILPVFKSSDQISQYGNEGKCSNAIFDFAIPIYKEKNVRKNNKNIQCDDDPCDDFSQLDRVIEIHIPYHTSTNRLPGIYEDLPSEYKKKHNFLIMKAAALLDAKECDITAMILDGKKMRTTNALLELGNLIETIHVIEINPETFQILKSKTRDNPKVQVYHSHIMDYILRGVDELINMVYLDTMCNFFDSERSYGTYSIITELLQQLKRDKIIFAATFCLRTGTAGFSYEAQEEEILTLLEQLLESFDYTFTPLIDRNEMRYKGQRITNLGMMFVLYYLKRRRTVKSYQDVAVFI